MVLLLNLLSNNILLNPLKGDPVFRVQPLVSLYPVKSRDWKSNPAPAHYECAALPNELSRRAGATIPEALPSNQEEGLG